MNVTQIIKQLKTKYPGKTIIQNNPANPTEIICEIISSAENPNESVAIAVIDQSIPHFHQKTTEVYEVIKGTLKITVDEKESLLQKGQKFIIKPNQVHSAQGNETWVKCVAKPGWKSDDHTLKTTNKITCVDIEGKIYFVPVNELTFRPAVYGVIIRDGKILLSKQWQGFDFPGGGIELGEPTDQALIREVKEETGIEVSVGKILHSNFSFFKLPFKNQFVHSIHLYYQCSVIGGKLSNQFLDENEKKYASCAEWIDIKQVGNIKIYNSTNPEKILASLLHLN